MMEIVFLAPSIKTGGGNRVFIELANELCERHTVSVVYPQNSIERNTFISNKKVKYIEIGSYSKNKLRKIWNLLCCIYFLNRKAPAAKVIISDPIFSLLIPLFKNKKNLYRFIQADDYRIYDDGKILGKGILLKLYKWFCLKSYQYKVAYIFNSKYVYEQYCMNAKRTDVPYKLVYPAINHAIFNNAKQNRYSGISICLVARKHPLKGLVTFLNVYKKLPIEIKSKISHVKLISHDDLSQFDTTGMDIIEPTCDNDIANVYQMSDIFISTSWWEGFGLPPLEAMSCGCAVITSKSGGVNEFAKDNENCLMFEPKNEVELTEKLIRMINEDNLRNRLSQEGVKAAQNFDWEKSALQLITIL